MQRLAAALAIVAVGAGVLAASTLGFDPDQRDGIGSWTPPPAVNAHYVITNEVVDQGWEGRLTDSAEIICSGAPHEGDVFWSGQQDGSLGGGATFSGRTTIFQVDDNNHCTATNVKARFWSLVENRLRVCPNSASAPEAEPKLDTTSEVGQSDNCTDFVRTEEPPTNQNKKHDATDYIGKIKRDTNKCRKFGPVDYSFKLKRVDDDPIVRVDVFVRQKGQSSFHRWTDGGGGEVNHFNVPISGEKSRTITLPWTHKKASTWKVRVKTQKKKTYTGKPRFFKACS
jgi:hypothetical protein